MTTIVYKAKPGETRAELQNRAIEDDFPDPRVLVRVYAPNGTPHNVWAADKRHAEWLQKVNAKPEKVV